MKLKVIHLSDLHFGCEDEFAVEGFFQFLDSYGPDALIVTGDLTQRAKSREFEKARAFFERISVPFLVLPGNHDIPLWSVLSRFLAPYKKYKRFIQSDLEPRLEVGHLDIQGVTTAHPWKIAGGRWKEPRAAHLMSRWSERSESQIRVLASHHPIDVFPNHLAGESRSQGRVQAKFLSKLSIDLLLSGHHHQAGAWLSSQLYREPHRPFVIVTSGTSLSHRTRNEPRSFQTLEFDSLELTVASHLNESRNSFERRESCLFRKTASGWVLA